MIATLEAQGPVDRRVGRQPVAYAVFAGNGNIRIWSTDSEPVRKLAEAEGLPLVPLYPAAHLEWMQALMTSLLDHLGERDNGTGNAPGHAHEVPGVWDSDNGELAGKPCAWCAVWAEAKASGLMTPNA